MREAMVRSCVLFIGFVVGVSIAACDSKPAPGSGPAEGVSADPGALPPEQLARVLAKVGDRVITLGDYKAALDRMDRFERMRYQTAQRRRTLLDEMVNVELLAREAERRGLHEQPETKAHIRMLQREEVTRRLRASLPDVAELPMTEVRAFYEQHKAEYSDPERRRVSVIRLTSAAAAEKVLALAKAGDAKRWGELVRQHSVPTAEGTPKPSKNEARPPLELEGDLGLVSAPGEARGGNPRVVEPVRAAVFAIAEQGDVHERVVAHDGSHYIVRLVGKSGPRRRSLQEAEATIRVQLLRARLKQLEEDLAAKLKNEFPVEINEEALGKLTLPSEPAQ
jgi:parvulin-like peptidyl-prolyl isomerase